MDFFLDSYTEKEKRACVQQSITMSDDFYYNPPIIFQNELQPSEVSNSDILGMRNFQDFNIPNIPFEDLANPVTNHFVARRPQTQLNFLAEAVIHLDTTHQRCPDPDPRIEDITAGNYRRASIVIHDEVIRKEIVLDAISILAQENSSEVYNYEIEEDWGGVMLLPDTKVFYANVEGTAQQSARVNVYVERRRLGLSHFLIVNFTFRSRTEVVSQQFDSIISYYVIKKILSTLYGNGIVSILQNPTRNTLVSRYYNQTLANLPITTTR